MDFEVQGADLEPFLNAKKDCGWVLGGDLRCLGCRIHVVLVLGYHSRRGFRVFGCQDCVAACGSYSVDGGPGPLDQGSLSEYRLVLNIGHAQNRQNTRLPFLTHLQIRVPSRIRRRCGPGMSQTSQTALNLKPYTLNP